MEPVTWSKENWMVEQHRQRHDPWRGKGYKKGGKETCHPREERETRQEDAGDRSKVEAANAYWFKRTKRAAFIQMDF